ncbi:uncharacterized protein NEMAJ01_0820 [Nematocida major]|uniref:uncharacterized protein n=1 Tax=Nematocida major TaxID=1912982 RepID=UPI0020087F97|nr:uncharacterized protein NEMAJ01_0820 [Nematocida major]KAH9385924.1 hypothetical protein NEMAJ01_0820 [Nematocida major]
MKYLEEESTANAVGEILEVKESTPGLNIMLETYSLKMTKKERKCSRSGKYRSMSSMISAALNLLFSDYEIRVTFRELKIISEEECKADLTNKLFTTGMTKNYQEMSDWIESVLAVIKKCAGDDISIIRVNIRSGPFEKYNWNECIAAHGRALKRVVLFTVLYSSSAESPLL